MSRNKLYIFVSTICVAGFVWIGGFLIQEIQFQKHQNSFELCLIKATTGVPCPSCGMTRSVTSIFQKKFDEALFYNPLGFVMAPAMLLFPLWILWDVLNKKNSFFVFFKKFENLFRNKIIITLGIVIILLVWIWNLYKHFN